VAAFEVTWAEYDLVEIDDEVTRRAGDLADADPAHGPERVVTAGDRGRIGPLYVYGRAGCTCRRCGTRIARILQGRDLPWTTFWCPTCKGVDALASAEHV
jgi:hypothetical protein